MKLRCRYQGVRIEHYINAARVEVIANMETYVEGVVFS
jgi:hypothetical protein